MAVQWTDFLLGLVDYLGVGQNLVVGLSIQAEDLLPTLDVFLASEKEAHLEQQVLVVELFPCLLVVHRAFQA